MFISTNPCVSRQSFCRGKNDTCSGMGIILSPSLSPKDPFCRDKHVFTATKNKNKQKTTFVATKMILVVAPANDSCNPEVHTLTPQQWTAAQHSSGSIVPLAGSQFQKTVDVVRSSSHVRALRHTDLPATEVSPFLTDPAPGSSP